MGFIWHSVFRCWLEAPGNLRTNVNTHIHIHLFNRTASPLNGSRQRHQRGGDLAPLPQVTIHSEVVWDGCVITEGYSKPALSTCMPMAGGSGEADCVRDLWVTVPPGPVPWGAAFNHWDLTFSHQTEAMPEPSQDRHLKSRCSQSGVMGKQIPAEIQIITPEHKPMEYLCQYFSSFLF